MDPAAAGLAEAMALGSRGSLEPAIRQVFRALGWSHLIAVSGLHVGFVAGLALGLIHLLRRRRTGLALAIILVFYAGVSGAGPPVVRATVMALLAISARAAERPLPTGRALALAALVSLLVAPRWLFDPGFQLSFGALSGIALLGPRIDWARPLFFIRRRGVLARLLLLPFWAGLAAQLGCLPILATTFHAVTPWGVVTAPLAVPLAGLFVSSVLLGLVLLPLPGPVGDGCLAGAVVVGEGLLALGRLGAAYLPAPWPVGTPGPLLIAGFVGGGLGVSRLRGSAKVRVAAGLIAGASAITIVTGLPPAAGTPVRVEVVFLDVGQGDAAIVLAHGSPGWLGRCGLPRRPQLALAIDVGDHPPRGFDAGAGIVAPALAAAQVREVDAVILSHGDRDHTGGLKGLAGTMPLAGIIWPRPFRLPAAVERLVRPRLLLPRGGSRPVPFWPVAVGDTLVDRPGLVLLALHPPAGFPGNENDGSLVVRLEALGQRLLFAGDVESSGEGLLCRDESDRLGCELVKVPHHGSATSSSTGFVAATGAAHAVVSVGARNRFGHPDPQVLARWLASGACLWRTDKQGAVIAILDSTGVRVSGVADRRRGVRRVR
jgi:competence protein ComEC